MAVAVECLRIAGRYITRDTHRPQWPVTKSQEINVFGRRLNILSRVTLHQLQTMTVGLTILESPNKNCLCFVWFLIGCHCLRAFNFHFLIMMIARVPMIISMIEIHCIPAHEEAFQMQMSD